MEKELKNILQFSTTDEEAKQAIADEVAKANLLGALDDKDLGIDISELGLTEEDLNNSLMMFNVDHEEIDTENFAKDKIVNLYRYVAHSSSGYGADAIGTSSRDFCRMLVRRTKTSLMRYVDILKLNGVNKGMGLNGANVYNVFKWRGGVHCKHLWVKYKYNATTRKLIEAPLSEQPKQSGKGGVPNA